MGVSASTRVGVLGGTFDPPHLAHLVLAAAARRTLALDRVVLVPAGDPWRKADRDVTPAATRLRLVEAAARSLPWAEVSAVEVERAGPTYSLETFEELAASEPDAQWWFLLGEDALADLPHWHEPQRLVEAVRFGLAQRPGAEPAASTLEAVPGLADRVDLVPMPALDVSASDLRARIARGEPTTPLLPGAVRAVVDDLGLYRAS
ncbi:MAG: nicotinate (nicotinamide) nucleotide adenylyltransferase [Chloroflexi bacterium]|nr:nicotinate (nicotinamide) nucleotide adenylyltransferase [Chloroflexota bacterium]